MHQLALAFRDSSIFGSAELEDQKTTAGRICASSVEREVSHNGRLDDLLRGMVAKRHGVSAICGWLGLTEDELDERLADLDLPRPKDRPVRRNSRPNAWMIDDIRRLIEGWVRGVSVSRLAEQMERSRSSIYCKSAWVGLYKRPRVIRRGAAEVVSAAKSVAEQGAAPVQPAPILDPLSSEPVPAPIEDRPVGLLPPGVESVVPETHPEPAVVPVPLSDKLMQSFKLPENINKFITELQPNVVKAALKRLPRNIQGRDREEAAWDVYANLTAWMLSPGQDGVVRWKRYRPEGKYAEIPYALWFVSHIKWEVKNFNKALSLRQSAPEIALGAPSDLQLMIEGDRDLMESLSGEAVDLEGIVDLSRFEDCLQTVARHHRAGTNEAGAKVYQLFCLGRVGLSRPEIAKEMGATVSKVVGWMAKLDRAKNLFAEKGVSAILSYFEVPVAANSQTDSLVAEAS